MPAIHSLVSPATSAFILDPSKLILITGAFGSGAAFALEDGWILARAIEYTRAHDQSLPEALEIFDEIRSPYYLRM